MDHHLHRCLCIAPRIVCSTDCKTTACDCCSCQTRRRCGPQQHARATLLAVALSYGSQDVALRLVLTLTAAPSPPAVALVKALIQAAAFAPPYFLSQSDGAAPPWSVSLGLAAALVASNEFLLEGIKRTSAAKAAFLLQLSVVFTPLLNTLCCDDGKARASGSASVRVRGLCVLTSSSRRLLRHNPAADRRSAGRGRGDGVGGVHRAHGGDPAGRGRARGAGHSRPPRRRPAERRLRRVI